MTDSSIAFAGAISEPLFLRAQSLHVRRRILLLVLFAASVAVGILVGFSGIPFLAKVLGIAGGFAAAPLIPVIQRRTWKRLYNRSPYLWEPIRGEVLDWGLKTVGSTGTSEVPWPKFQKYKIDDRIILLYLGPNIFHLVSAEFFATSDDWTKARQVIVERSGVKVG